MRKLWLLSILFLTTVSTASEQPIGHKPIQIIVEEPVVERIKYYPVYDSGYVIDSTEVYLFEGNAKITKNMYDKLVAMIDSALVDSVFIHINSGYRTFEEQYSCRIRNVRHKSKRYDSLYLLNAEAKHFRPITAKPGYSSHNRGIAFDFNTADKAVYKWLQDNALKHGFVRTVKQEKWHWEYLPETTDKYQFVKESHRSWRI